MAGEEGVGKWAKVGPGGDIYTVGTDGRGGGLWHAWLITGYAPGIVSSPARSLFPFFPWEEEQLKSKFTSGLLGCTLLSHVA